MIKEGDKVKLLTEEIAFISEVLEDNVAYIAEVLNNGGGVSIEQISHKDIASVFEEIEFPLAKAM